MAIDLVFRRKGVAQLPVQIGCYVLCDLDQVPLYVGKSSDGIRRRVQRHLTSARSDVIANRQIDVWEIAWVWAYPVEKTADLAPLEALLFHHFHPKSALMNGQIPAKPTVMLPLPTPEKIVQVMKDSEIAEKLDPALRLPRQAERYSEIVAHFLAVKNSKEVARAMQAHFERLQKYHRLMLGQAIEESQTDD